MNGWQAWICDVIGIRRVTPGTGRVLAHKVANTCGPLCTAGQHNIFTIQLIIMSADTKVFVANCDQLHRKTVPAHNLPQKKSTLKMVMLSLSDNLYCVHSSGHIDHSGALLGHSLLAITLWSNIRGAYFASVPVGFPVTSSQWSMGARQLFLISFSFA